MAGSRSPISPGTSLPKRRDRRINRDLSCSRGLRSACVVRLPVLLAVVDVGTRWCLHFNRARNPFCAYSSAYPCPAPWNGNTIPIPVTAGEQYRPLEAADSAVPSTRRQ